jgi:antitoxin HicB
MIWKPLLRSWTNRVEQGGLKIRPSEAIGSWEAENVLYRVPLVFTPQPEGGYTVTSPVLPELVTEGDTLEEANANVRDAFEAVAELYAEQGRSLPASISLPVPAEVVWFETLVGSP